jgi:uncharacterized membrane protein YfcA
VTLAAALLLVAAGFAAGLTGTIAGLASLFSYPALLAVGLPPVPANVTNTVALTVNTIGAVAGSRPELAGQGRAVRRLALPVLLGGATGAALLLLTPSEAFEAIVPVLVGAASVVLLVQPRIRAAAELRAAARGAGGSGRHVAVGLFAIAIYGGYFGAAAGVLMLALLLVGLPVTLLQGNALKNLLLGLANIAAAIGFAFLGPVDWAAAGALAAGLLVGSRLGPVVARALPATPLRIGIGIAGLGLAVALATGLL